MLVNTPHQLWKIYRVIAVFGVLLGGVVGILLLLLGDDRLLLLIEGDDRLLLNEIALVSAFRVGTAVIGCFSGWRAFSRSASG